MADAEKLNIVDAESAYKALSDLIMKYPNFPTGFKADNTTVRWNGTGSGQSIGLFPLGGAIYLKKYVSGSYVAQIPFEVVYKCSPTTNKASIAAQELLTDICSWMEKCGIDFKSDTHITLEKIARTTPVFIIAQDEKSTEFAINMQLNYSFKK